MGAAKGAKLVNVPPMIELERANARFAEILLTIRAVVTGCLAGMLRAWQRSGGRGGDCDRTLRKSRNRDRGFVRIETQLDIANAQDLARFKAGLCDPDPVDESAVCGIEVPNQHRIVHPHDLTMQGRDGLAGYLQVVIRSAAQFVDSKFQVEGLDRNLPPVRLHRQVRHTNYRFKEWTRKRPKSTDIS